MFWSLFSFCAIFKEKAAAVYPPLSQQDFTSWVKDLPSPNTLEARQPQIAQVQQVVLLLSLPKPIHFF